MISPPTAKIEAWNKYKVGEHRVANNLGQVSAQDVARFVRKWPAKPTATVNQGERKKWGTYKERGRKIWNGNFQLRKFPKLNFP